MRHVRAATSALLTLLAIVFAIPNALAQPYPDRPIRIIVPAGPGGLADLLARLLGEKMQSSLGQPVIVDSRPGAGGLLGGELGARAKPDGYTVLMVFSSFPLLPHTAPKMRFDIFKDLDPITKAIDMRNVVVAGAGAPYKSIGELITYAKANPGKISYGSSGVGTTTHLSAEMIKQRAGIDMVMVPYKTTQQTYQALFAGEIGIAVDTVSGSMPHIRAGKLVPLVVLSDQRSPVLPEVPTVAEVGLSGAQAPSWFGFMVPAGTPKEITTRLQREMAAILKTPEVIDYFGKLGAETVGDTPEHFGHTIRSEFEAWGAVIRKAKLKFD